MARMDRYTRRWRRGTATKGDLWLKVAGYKAIKNATEVRVAPLTIIAGTNSSGKSSFLQPFLMMKQTLDSAFDPGPLLLHGPNVRITDRSQMMSKGGRDRADTSFSAGLRVGNESREVTFTAGAADIEIAADVVRSDGRELRLTPKPNAAEMAALRNRFAKGAAMYLDAYKKFDKADAPNDWTVEIDRNRCFLDPGIVLLPTKRSMTLPLGEDMADDAMWVHLLRGIIHVPGLRGNPERSYPRSAVGNTYPGTFETYVASVIDQWTVTNDPRLSTVSSYLEVLGLTWKLEASRLNDASIELRVGRTPHAGPDAADDMVSVADVGFGVSQTLPVLVALLAAREGQIVYLEQPEIHLHPRAQLALSELLVDAAKRGVRLIVETHSSLVIRGVQTAVAEGSLPSKSLSLNWFGRDAEGFQTLTVAEVDPAGRFGDWPVDFDDVSRDADWAYLDAVQARD